MGKYGSAAIKAVSYITKSYASNPVEAWNNATIEIFGKDTPSQKKGCPKGAFLGLCESGFIKGVKSGKYTNSIENKKYAVEAVKILKNNPQMSKNEPELWFMVAGNKTHNQQIGVVIALWNAQLILLK